MADYNVQEAVKRVVARASHQAGVTQLIRRLADQTQGPRLLILMYHRIAERPDRYHPALSTKTFADHIAHVAKHYPCLTADQVCDYLQGRRPLDRTSVAVTFDDGYQDTATIAQPILKRCGVSSMVFLATSAIGTGQALWSDRLGEAFKVTTRPALELDRPGFPPRMPLGSYDERVEALKCVGAYAKQIPQLGLNDFIREVQERLGVQEEPYDGMLSWDQVIALDREGMEVGGHTINHQTLSRLPLDRAQEEIERSKHEIEQRLGHGLKLFCYPNGTWSDITPAVKRIVQKAGFVAAVAAEEGANVHDHSDAYALLRVPAYQTHVPLFAMQLVRTQCTTPPADRLPTGFRVEVVETEQRWDAIETAWRELLAPMRAPASLDSARDDSEQAPRLGLTSLGASPESIEGQARRTGGSFFLSWEWLRTWWETFGGGPSTRAVDTGHGLAQDSAPRALPASLHKRLWVLAVWHPDGRLIGLAPWYIRTERAGGVVPSRVVRWIGDGELVAPEYLDVIARSEDAADVAQTIGQYLMERCDAWDLAELRRVLPGSVAMQRLQAIVRGAGGRAVAAAEPMPCPYVDLPPTWEEYAGRLSQNMRHNIQRRRKKLEKEFPEHAFTVGLPDGSVERALEVMREIHAKRKGAQGIVSPFTKTAYIEFHRRLAKRLTRREQLYFSTLSLGGTVAAAQYGFRDGQTLYAYQIAFDPAFGKYGVAQLLMGRIIETEIQRGTQRIDFMRGDEPYKYDWTSTEHRLVRVELSSQSIRGSLAAAVRKGRSQIGRWLRRQREGT